MDELNDSQPCPYCGAEIRAGARKCHCCGHWLKKQCPHCGQWIAIRARKCRFCGAWLDEGQNTHLPVNTVQPVIVHPVMEQPVENVPVLIPLESTPEPELHERSRELHHVGESGRGVVALYFALEMLVPVLILICRYMTEQQNYLFLVLGLVVITGICLKFFNKILVRGIFSVLASGGWALLGLVAGPMIFDQLNWVSSCELIAFNFYQYWWLGLVCYLAALALHIPVLSSKFKVLTF